jgi:hypothetical protein
MWRMSEPSDPWGSDTRSIRLERFEPTGPAPWTSTMNSPLAPSTRRVAPTRRAPPPPPRSNRTLKVAGALALILAGALHWLG